MAVTDSRFNDIRVRRMRGGVKRKNHKSHISNNGNMLG